MASLSPKSERRSSVLLGRRPSAGHRRGAPSISATSAASTQDGLQALIRQAAAGLDEPALAQTLADLDNPTSSASAFLASLTTQTLKGVESQPQLLASSSKTLDEQLATLCQRHVASLAHVHQSTSALPAAVQSVQGNINDLFEEALPQLTQAAQAFPSQTREALAARQRANELLEAHASTLPDLLDIPDLITSCIRNGNHTEAIQLASHIAKLARNDSALGGGPILQSLKVRSWVSLQELRDQLLESLQSRALSLSSAKRTITSLRGLKDLDESSSSSSKRAPPLMLTEPQLCLAFLRARATLLRHTLAAPTSVTKTVTSATPSVSHLAAYIDVWRQGVTETCSMAQSLFSSLDGLPQLLAAFLRRHTKLLEVEVEREVRKLVDQVVSSNSANAPGSSSSSSQLSRQIDDLASSLLSLHSQLSYAVAALGRLGGDMAPLLAASTGRVLEAAAVQLVRVPAQRAVRRFGEQFPSAPGMMPSSWLSEMRDVAKLAEGGQELDSLAPQFGPLARLFNDVALGLNCLRTFAPVSIRKEALRTLDHALVEATTQLNHSCARLPEQQSEGTSNRLQLPTLQAGDQEDDDDETRQQVDALSSSPHRLTQAERLLASSAISILLDVLAPRLRSALWRDVFGASEESLPPLASAGSEGREAIATARQWAEDARTAWMQGEEARRVEVGEVRRRRGEERQRDREEKEKREREEVERARKEQEEAERRRKEEEEAEKRRKQQEAERLAAEEKKRAAEEAEREERRRREAEAAAKAKAEEETRRKAEAEAAAAEKRSREAEAEEARKQKQAEEEEARRKMKEDEERAATAAAAAAAAETKRKKEEEAAAKKKEEEEEATARRKQQQQEEEEAKIKAEAQAKAAAEEEARNKAAKAKEDADARAKAEEEARAAAVAKAAPQPAQAAQEEQPSTAPAQDEPSKAESSETKPTSAPAPSSSTPSSSIPSSAAPSPATGTSELPSSGAPPAKKMTLAEKLKAKREERERQAAAAAAAAAKETAPESTASEPAKATPQAAVEGVKSEAADQVAAQPPTASVQDQADPAPSSPSAKEEAAAMPSESTQQPAPAPSPPGETPISSVPARAEASANNSGEESDGGEGGAAANGGNGGSSVDSGIGKGAGGAKKKKKRKGKKRMS